jgi:hypothetical protein
MSPKSRRKSKKFTAPRPANPANISTAGSPNVVKQRAAPSAPIRPRSGSQKAAEQALPAAVYTNFSREMKTIGMIALVLMVALVVVAIVLSK